MKNIVVMVMDAWAEEEGNKQIDDIFTFIDLSMIYKK
jgi:hypothetical protein